MAFIVPDEIEKYATACTSSASPVLKNIERETWDTMKIPEMLTGPLAGQFLKMLVEISQASRVLEVGMFTGYGTLSMAEGLPRDGKIYTCELDKKHIDFAKKYFAESPHGSKIEILEGSALDSIPRIKVLFDFVFIDAAKAEYENYYEACLPLVRQGGLIAFDNALREGKVLKPDDDGTRAIDQLNRKLVRDPRVECVLLTVRDGIMLARKK